MVYSEAFRNLPAEVKRRVLQKMRSALSGNDPAYDCLKASTRSKIDAILTETLPDWRR
jgi:hypothetical protein